MKDCYDGNIAGGVDTSCRWYAADDGECYDPDHNCPDGSLTCCHDCENLNGCKYSCQAVSK